MLYTETPDKTKGISWAVLEDNVSGKRRMFCCTHFWWKTGPEHDVIRLKNADELAALVKTITAKYNAPAFIFGDLNTHYDDSPFKRLVEHGFEYLMETAEQADKMSSWHGDPVKVSEDKYVGSKTQNDFRRSLDHIFSFNNKSLKSKRCLLQTAFYRIVEN